jgi:hypothetical protein
VANLKQLREAFDPQLHCYAIDLTFYYEHADFYTKKGQVSSKTQDLSNCEKILIDCICLPKFFTEYPPYGIENLNVDDRFVVDLVSRKRPADKQAVHFTISIIDKP